MSSLRRITCVDIPDLPLQILLRSHPEYRDFPAAVVAEERPESPLLLVNRHARDMRLRTGMRFGAAKSLVPELRVGSVSAVDVEQTVSQLVHDLQTFSPHVERDPVSAGVFYVDPSGLSHLYGGELNWARCVYRYLTGRRFFAAVVVGFGRTLSYALARTTRGVKVVEREPEALELAREVPLERLHVTPKLRDSLERLGLTTLGDLCGFGADQLGTRFGAEAARWCRVAQAEEVLPLCAEPHVDTPRTEVEVDPPDDDVARLCFALKRGLDSLLENVRQRGQSVRALWMRLVLERGPENVQRLEPSSSTRDAALLLELLRLRLTALNLASRVERVVLEAEMSDAAPGQLNMFIPKRDLAAGDRALARIKASYGPDVVCRAELEDAHLPEAKFRFSQFSRLEKPKPQDAPEHAALPLVRRLLLKPEPMSGSVEVDAMSRAKTLVHAGEPYALVGPYRLSGGWWAREVTRDYYYARSPRGELLWVFYDGPRASWFLHGVVD
ncbi:MAG: DNA polymerase Y family protein [Myxococcales bacterium]